MIRTAVGDNDYLLHEFVKEQKQQMLDDFGEYSVETISGDESELDRIADAIQSLPFLVERKLVVIANASKNKQFLESYESILDRCPDTIDVLFVEGSIDKRSRFYTYLKKRTELHEFMVLDHRGLAAWVQGYVTKRGGTITAASIALLIDRVGANQLRLQHELEKLLLYQSKITKENIELLTVRTPQSSVFDLIRAALSNDKKTALRLYEEQREQRVEPQMIIGMLVWQLHVLCLIHASKGKAARQIASEAKISPFAIEKSMSLAKNTSFERLKKNIEDILDIDMSSKQQSVDVDQLLQAYILNL